MRAMQRRLKGTFDDLIRDLDKVKFPMRGIVYGNYIYYPDLLEVLDKYIETEKEARVRVNLSWCGDPIND